MASCIRFVLITVLTVPLLAGCNSGSSLRRPATPLAGTHEYGGGRFEPAKAVPRLDTVDDPISTFGLDADDASYVHARSWLRRGKRPDPHSIRVEEFVNRFDYDYPAPVEGAVAVQFDGCTVLARRGSDALPTPPDGSTRRLLRIGMRARGVVDGGRPDALVVAVVDLSRSMGAQGKLNITQEALRQAAATLQSRDLIAIIGVGEQEKLLLPPTSAAERGVVKQAIDGLGELVGRLGAGSDLSRGVNRARETLAGVSRRGARTILLFSDGVETGDRAESGLDGSQARTARAEQPAPVVAVGVGYEYYDDVELKALGRGTDGCYLHLDSVEEAQARFGAGLGALLFPLIRDAEAQVRFDPDVVTRWRLLGYGDRVFADQKFGQRSYDGRNGDERGGELRMGDSVTALYEVDLRPLPDDAGSPTSIGTLELHYRLEGNADPIKRAFPVPLSALYEESDGARLAEGAARVAEILGELPGLSKSDIYPVLLRLDELRWGHLGGAARQLSWMAERTLHGAGRYRRVGED